MQEKGHKIDPNNMHEFEEYKKLKLKIIEDKKENKSKEKEKKK